MGTPLLPPGRVHDRTAWTLERQASIPVPCYRAASRNKAGDLDPIFLQHCPPVSDITAHLRRAFTIRQYILFGAYRIRPVSPSAAAVEHLKCRCITRHDLWL
ncbi:hypothetical protein NHX12_003841 [Muraenolepis orangiensis]|uniref:Uncharacterized protein n=1 Tax=Muraenolepis orangiensis TaxID=630683 RepID=A0A9Q0IDA2_9TELE|nr:hypothetical protein NHX12_003841 [Muraenolepis orangiensis]